MHLLKEGQKIRAWVDPPPIIRAMPERKRFFFIDVFPKYVCLFSLNYYLAVGLNGTNKPARHYNLAGHIAYCYYRCQQNTGYIDTCPRPNNAQNDPPKSAFHRNVAQFALEYNTLTKHSLSFCSQYSVHQFSLAIKYSPPS